MTTTDEMFDPNRPERHPLNIVTMAELVKAAGQGQTQRFVGVLDRFAQVGGQATHLIWTLSLEQAASLHREVGGDWAQVVETTSSLKQAEVAALLAISQEGLAQHAAVAEEDAEKLRRLDPPPRTVRDVKARLHWGSTRASEALRAYRRQHRDENGAGC